MTRSDEKPLRNWVYRVTGRAFALGLALIAGCADHKQPAEGDAAATKQLPFAGVTLKLLVVGDARLAETIGQLRGEWRASTGADVDVAEMSEQELEESTVLDADAVIYPAYELGPLAEHDLLRPLDERELNSPDLAWQEIFETDKSHDAAWAGRSHAFPFGSPTLVCCYRKDLLEKLARQPPTTWADYEALAELLTDRKPEGDAGWSGTCEPLAEGWAGLTLLARAAAYAKHRSHYSTLFDMESMDPLIAGPQFARALDELRQAHKLMSSAATRATPERVHEALLTGKCGLALTWTSPAFAPADAGGGSSKVEIGFAPLPGSPQAFNPKTGEWDARREDEKAHVPLAGISGVLGSVAKASQQPQAAFHLLGWLSGPEWSERVSPSAANTTLFRRSHLKTPQTWADSRLDELAALNYAETVEHSLGSAEVFGAPRIAGRKRYLAALDDAVQAALAGEKTSEEALAEAADTWRRITGELGLDRQRTAYRRSLGLR